MLEDTQETVRLATDCNSQSKVLHSVGNITSCKQLLTKLNLNNIVDNQV